VDDLIIRVLSGKATPFEVERLRRWREEASENDALYREVAQVWSLTAPEPVTSIPEPPPVEEILRGATPEEGIGGPRRRQRTKGGPPPWTVWGLMAASVAALALGIRVVGFPGPSALAEYPAPGDGPRTVTLEDGSFVRLAAGSMMRVWDTEEAREVSLEGRAFFAVTRDEARPFTVRTSSGEVRVLGTRFEVAEEAASVRTIVVEGRVAVTNAHGSVEVPAGGLARMSREEAPATEMPEDIWALLDWNEGILVFQDTPLADVAREVSRYFGRPFSVSDPDLGNRRITAWFQVEPFQEVVESICLVVDATCSFDAEGAVALPRDDGGVVR